MKTQRMSAGAERRGRVVWTVLELLFLVVTCLFFIIWMQHWFLVRLPTGEAGDRARGLSEMQSQGSAGISASGRMNVLCLGVDSVEGTHRTDTILLVGVEPHDRRVTVLSIPRDTRVLVNGSAHKINEIYARHGENVLRGMLEELLEIRIDRSVLVDFQGFIDTIDLLGGIDLMIEQPMHYDDNWGNVHIHFDPGQTHLNGKRALEYVRFRADSAADLGRIKRQQRFIAAILEKLKTPAIVMRLPSLIQEVYRNIQTDLRVAEILELAGSLKGGQISVQTMSLPGDARYIDKISYYLPYKDQAVAIGARHYATLSLLDLEASYTPAIASRTP
ncbi:MAG TPA: LCP family protein [Candidatus Ozemobacteraceae bacterium]